jgi:hypothetical protein
MEYENIFPKLPLHVRYRLTLVISAIWFLLWDLCKTCVVGLTDMFIVIVVMPTFSPKIEDVVLFLEAIQAGFIIVLVAAYLSFRITAAFIRHHIIPTFLLVPKKGQ